MDGTFMKIGITERGDPSIDFSWVEKSEKMDGVILITKNLTDKMIDEVKKNLGKYIFHITCTGYGGTIIEPNIPNFQHQLKQAKKLLDIGVPVDRIVIRIDPIIPTVKGMNVAGKVFLNAISMGFKRFRVSVMDAYPHVRERMRQNGIEPPYGDMFTAPQEMFENVDSVVRQLKKLHPDISIESCAEGKLKETTQTGCVSKKDLDILGIKYDNVDNAGYQRKGCLCCSAKTELLLDKKQCPYKCMYCYWKNEDSVG